MFDRSTMRDRDYLRDVQYRDSTRLGARADLHRKYSTAPRSWTDFVLHQVDLRPGSRVLELGCGPGWLWREAGATVPDGVRLTLTDLSPAMVEEAVAGCRATGRFAAVSGRPADAQDLPFEDEGFDYAIANHMLYHVPDPGRAVAEARRVLSPEGTFLAATNGPAHLLELRRLQQEALGRTSLGHGAENFGADTGWPVLRRAFAEVTWRQFEDELLCTDPADVAAYLRSLSAAGTDGADEQEDHALRSAIDRAFTRGNGILRVTKDVGIFVCRWGRPARAS